MPNAPELVFPWVVPTNADLTCFEGPISCAGDYISGLWLRLEKIPQNSATLEGAVLRYSQELGLALGGQEHIIKQRLRDSPSVAAFFTEIQSLLERQASQGPIKSLPTADFYSTVLQQCEDLGWASLCSLSEDMRSLTMCVKDNRGRDHLVHCQLAADFPQSPPSAECELPAQLELQWPSHRRNLTEVHRAFADAIEQWQPLWASLEDLDDNCWVLEPEQPRRSDLFRRVSIGGFCSLRVTLDASEPLCPPEARFLGPDASVSPLRKKWTEALDAGSWNQALLLRGNIEQVLGIDLPLKSAPDQDENAGVCGICYSYYSSTAASTATNNAGNSEAASAEPLLEAPDVNCDNAPCGRPYHRSCLVEWLRGLTDTRQSFNILFGQCVYCTAPLSVKMEESNRH